MRWWVPFAVLGAVGLVALGVVAVLFVTRDDPEARSVDDALEEFRSGNDEGDGAAAGGEGAAADATPPAGVYELLGEGREAISFPPVQQTDGATMPMTVSPTDDSGCFTVRIDYNEAHWQDWALCRDGELMIEDGGRTFQRWDLGAAQVENLSTFVCDPPITFIDFAAGDGQVDERSCEGTNDAVEGTTVTSGTDTHAGRVTLTIGGEEVEAIHVVQDHVVSGAQSGVSNNEYWFRASDGLPLKGLRSSTIDSESPVGTVTYTEQGRWELSSTSPQR